MVQGPSAGFAFLDEAADKLTGHHRLDAIRAHLFEMAGDTEEAMAHYGAAASRTTSLSRPALPGQAGRETQNAPTS
jgi:predicted RNA polymerase sigma factor